MPPLANHYLRSRSTHRFAAQATCLGQELGPLPPGIASQQLVRTYRAIDLEQTDEDDAELVLRTTFTKQAASWSDEQTNTEFDVLWEAAQGEKNKLLQGHYNHSVRKSMIVEDSLKKLIRFANDQIDNQKVTIL